MKPVPRWFIILTWVMAVGFSMCAGLQVNDPDPAAWIAIYAAAAITSALLPARRVLAACSGAVGLAAAVWSGYLAHDVQGKLAVTDLWMKMSEKGGAVEIGREAAGLGIVALSLIATSTFRITRA